jgi:hypothetical protein
MTEQEWLTCADHQPMLAFLHGKASDRKLRLFSVACCDRYRHVLTDERCRTAVRVGEGFADGLATSEELSDAEEAVWQADQLGELRNDGLGAACACCCYRQGDGSYPSGYAREVANQMLVALGNEITSDASYEAECNSLSNLLRCIFGPVPFRPVPLNLAWLSLNVRKLAAAIYEERAFERLPILADALEDAGCNIQDILEHCRQPDEHVRGCWCLDLILGKD